MIESLKESRNGTIIEIEVVPNSSEFKLEYSMWSKRLKIKVKSPAIKGQANNEILSFFKEVFKEADIVKGMHNKKKSIFVNYSLEEVSKKLSKIIK